MKHDDALPALTDDEIIDMVRDADLDWHAGYPVGEDEANRYATLARAVEQRVRTALAAREGEPVGEIVELGSRAEPKSDALGSANRAKVDAEQGWRRECDDTDAVLRLIGLDPEQCRTDGGSLNVPKIGSLLRDRATALAYLCPAGCGCTWRDNGDGSMSLYGPSSRSCAVCETMPLSKLLPLFAAPPALREAARLALEALENCSSEHGHRCNRCDSEVDEGGTIADALRAALAAEQPQPEAQPMVELMREADAIVRAKPTWKRYIDGTPLSNDIAVWMVDFARQHAPPPAAEPSEAELPPLPIGEAEVVWHEPDPVMPERPGKIIDASIAFFDAAPLGTHLYTAEQMRDYALRAAAAARGR